MLPLPSCLVPPTPGRARSTHLSPETPGTSPSQSLHLICCCQYKEYCRCQKRSAIRRCFTGKYKNEGPCFLSLFKTAFRLAGVHSLDVFNLMQYTFRLQCCSRQNPSHGFTFFPPSAIHMYVTDFIQVIHTGRDHSSQRQEARETFFEISCTNRKCLTFGISQLYYII